MFFKKNLGIVHSLLFIGAGACEKIPGACQKRTGSKSEKSRKQWCIKIYFLFEVLYTLMEVYFS